MELLRIPAMLLIVLHHFSAHGKWPGAGGWPSADLAVSFLSLGGKAGVDIFILISGYFLCKSNFRSLALANHLGRMVLFNHYYSLFLLCKERDDI